MTPWIALADVLLKQGLPVLAEKIRKQPLAIAADLGRALGAPPSPGQIEDAIAADPQAVEKLAALEVQIYQMDAEDRAQARLLMANNVWTGPLAISVVALFGVYSLLLLFVEIPPGNKDAAMVVLGVLGTGGFAGVMQFFFGSSLGSKIKTEATVLRGDAAR